MTRREAIERAQRTLKGEFSDSSSDSELENIVDTLSLVVDALTPKWVDVQVVFGSMYQAKGMRSDQKFYYALGSTEEEARTNLDMFLWSEW